MNPVAKPIVLVAEDHEMVGQGLLALLQDQYDVLELVQDGSEVLRMVATHHPAILLLDLALPGRNGLDLIKDVKQQSPTTAILVVTMHADPVLARLAFRLGADGFVSKGADSLELLEAIRSVSLGNKYLSSQVPPLHTGPQSAAAEPSLLRKLTRKQMAIMRGIAEGLTTEELAVRLEMSVHTVYFHRRNIRRALGIQSDDGLAHAALMMNFSTESEDPPPSPGR